MQRSGIADSRTREEVAEVAGVWASVVGLYVTLLGHFSFLLPFIPVLLLHLSHACIAPRPLGLASSFLGSLYLYFLGVDSLSWP